MCVQDMDPRRAKGLWRALLAYFRAYPPLVQSHGCDMRRARSARSELQMQGHAPTGKTRPRIRIYW